MQTEADIRALVAKAIAAGLEGADALADAPSWALARIYNGCGAEWMSESFRQRLTKWLEVFESAFLIHDWDFSDSDGTRAGFVRANERLERNCRKLADFIYPWYNWRRYAARALAPVVYEAVSCPGGWLAWQQAAEECSLPPNERNNHETSTTLLSIGIRHDSLPCHRFPNWLPDIRLPRHHG